MLLELRESGKDHRSLTTSKAQQQVVFDLLDRADEYRFHYARLHKHIKGGGGVRREAYLRYRLDNSC